MFRLLRLLAASWLVMAIVAPPAWADAAGPTDYQSEIVAIEPADAPIEVEIIGGDAFVQMRQLAPVEIVVIGYRGEHYLRFDADGTVVENQRSPSTFLNEDRYGTDAELPPSVDHLAPPLWRRVGMSGSHAWHDHRSHWMNPAPPPGAVAGDQVVESVIPLLIGGEAVSITVASYLLAGPSPWPGPVGAVLALGVVAFGLRRGRGALTAATLGVAAAALALGAIAYGSVPAETVPDRLLWLLPAIAVAALALVAVVRNRLATTVYLDGLMTTAGATLGWWSVSRFDALTKSLIPSDAPASLDRIVIGAGVVAGLALVLRGLWGLLYPERLIEPS